MAPTKESESKLVTVQIEEKLLLDVLKSVEQVKEHKLKRDILDSFFRDLGVAALNNYKNFYSGG